MDIDEFLDRELLDLERGLDLEEAETKPEKHSEDTSQSLESIKSNPTKGNLEETEQSYIQLWKVLMEQKLNWNKEIYGQISAQSRRILSTLDQAFNEAKSKSIQISDLLGRGKMALSQKKKDMAIKIYGQIQELSNSIPGIFFEEKKILKDQIEDFYRQLSDTTENELIQKVAELARQIGALLEKIGSAVAANDAASAASDYYRCIDLYNQIPEGFLRQKSSLGIKLIEIYKSLSISTQISELQKQLGSQIPKAPIRAYASPQYQRPMTQIKKYSQPKSVQFSPHSRKSSRNEETITQSSSPLKRKREQAKKNIKKGFYNEAWKNIEEALQMDPKDVESITLKAKIKTLQ